MNSEAKSYNVHQSSLRINYDLASNGAANNQWLHPTALRAGSTGGPFAVAVEVGLR